jgi:citrate synthase
MSDEVLFTITQENLETGMRGYPVGYCTTSSVDPMKGLFYVGRPVTELADRSPEEVIYLLFFGKEATAAELKNFRADLAKRSHCSPDLLSAIRALPKRGHPMKLFCAALLLAGVFEGKDDYREDALNAIALIPQLTATVIGHHAGWPTQAPKADLGYIENFVHMLNVPKADPKNLTEAFRLFEVLHFDHGGGNLSAFVGKAVCSGLEDLYGSLAAAMAALAGPRHGKANQDCLKFVQEVLNEVGEDGSAEDVEHLIRGRLARNELVFGFGHAVLRVEDPRATQLFAVANRHYANHALVKIANLLRAVGPKVLKENPKISNPFPNVDSISGTLLSVAGFPYPDYFTVLFGMSRVVGISRQICYERLEARDGKGTPIVRPKYLYKSRES